MGIEEAVRDQKNEKTTEKRKGKNRFRRTKKELLAELEQMETELDENRGKLITLEEEIKSLTDDIRDQEEERLRLLAEMDNVRKRTQRRFEDERRFVVSDILRPFLDVADNLERALLSAEKEENCLALAQGVKMVYKQLSDVFSQHGVTVIETEGESFDYNLHEAVSRMPVSGKVENEIVAEIARGYLLNDKLLRPSRVILATGEDPGDEV